MANPTYSILRDGTSGSGGGYWSGTCSSATGFSFSFPRNESGADDKYLITVNDSGCSGQTAYTVDVGSECQPCNTSDYSTGSTLGDLYHCQGLYNVSAISIIKNGTYLTSTDFTITTNNNNVTASLAYTPGSSSMLLKAEVTSNLTTGQTVTFTITPKDCPNVHFTINRTVLAVRKRVSVVLINSHPTRTYSVSGITIDIPIVNLPNDSCNSATMYANKTFTGFTTLAPSETGTSSTVITLDNVGCNAVINPNCIVIRSAITTTNGNITTQVFATGAQDDGSIAVIYLTIQASAPPIDPELRNIYIAAQIITSGDQCADGDYARYYGQKTWVCPETPPGFTIITQLQISNTGGHISDQGNGCHTACGADVFNIQQQTFHEGDTSTNVSNFAENTEACICGCIYAKHTGHYYGGFYRININGQEYNMFRTTSTDVNPSTGLFATIDGYRFYVKDAPMCSDN